MIHNTLENLFRFTVKFTSEELPNKPASLSVQKRKICLLQKIIRNTA
jgi:hypothetical protein